MTAARTVALVGTTASGKSDAAHHAALAHGRTEIVSLDSMAAYRGMDLATAKPTTAMRHEVPYHLVDVLDPSEELTVRRFQALALDAIDSITARGATALLVGGSGLYYRAVVDRFDIPPHDVEVRQALEAIAARPGGLEGLAAELGSVDPVAMARIEPRNARAIVRALEVVRASGRPFSSFGSSLTTYPPSDVAAIGVRFDPERVDGAIEVRLRGWVAGGLLDELRSLLAAPGGLSRTARQAAGYRQLLAHVEGDRSLDDALADAITATRRLARRQWRWFRRDPRITWVDDALAARAALDESL